MTTIPPVVPPLPVKSRFALDLPANAGFDWLAAGWRDLRTEPGPSLAYGVFVLALSAAIVAGLWWLGLGSILFPALAGFLVFAPALATGLYEKSRALENGEPVSFAADAVPAPRIGRADAVHRRAAVRADAAVDARGDHHLRAVLRREPVPRRSRPRARHAADDAAAPEANALVDLAATVSNHDPLLKPCL